MIQQTTPAHSAALFNVRVRVMSGRPDAYFDLVDLEGSCEDEALGYAIRLSTECFGLPFRALRFTVISRKPIIDC